MTEEHRTILAAIRSADHEAAGDAMRRHIVATKQDLIYHLVENTEGESASAPAFDHQNIW